MKVKNVSQRAKTLPLKMRRLLMPVVRVVGVVCFFLLLGKPLGLYAQSADPVYLATIDGTINPASDDYLRTSLAKAKEANAQLFVLSLNTPGGLLTSMQTMVAQLLESPVPTVVFVSPSGGGAISAGVFITMAGHFAVMAPGTTIGAAHPVSGGGQDVKGHMGEKVENFTVSLARAIAEQRGRNVDWAEKAVRESVAITDREAVEIKVVDFVASDVNSLLEKLEGKEVSLKSRTITLEGLRDAPRVDVAWSLKQVVINILSNPNIAILLGLGALAGLGIELYNPGLIVPGVVGAVCLILSLTAGQVLPISQGGVALLLLGAVLFVVEFFVPAFGAWGIAGIVCFVLGSIYFIDSDMVWSTSEFAINATLIGSIAGGVGICMLLLGFVAVRSYRSPVATGQEALLGKTAKVRRQFVAHGAKRKAEEGWFEGTVSLMGEIWQAQILLKEGQEPPSIDEEVQVVRVDGLRLEVKRIQQV